jgi:integrase
LDRPVGPVLIVRNAKATNGRAHGDSRTLLLAELEPVLLDAILSLIRIISEHIATGASFAELQKSMSNAVYRESRKCWPRRENHISLYTMRHQFSANMKATEIGRQELAAIMGHATDRTAGLHYARKVTGRKVTYHVTPLAHEVSRVKNRYSAFAQGKPKGIRLKGP